MAGTAAVDSTIPIDWPMEVKPNGGSYSAVNRYELEDTGYATRTGALWTNNSNHHDWSGTNQEA